MRYHNKILPTLIVLVLIGTVVWAVKTEAPEKPNNAQDNIQTIDTTGWLNTSDQGVTFSYPENVGTKYISIVDWPPKVQIENEPYNCTQAGEESSRAGETKIENIGANEYCVTTESEGAAGSVYSMYAYKKSMGDKSIILTFSLRFVQCYNYDEPNRDECLAERDNFEISKTIDQIFQTIK